MLDDMVIDYEFSVKESRRKGSSRVTIADVTLIANFETKGSEKIANRIESGKFPRKFTFLTESEKSIVQEVIQDLVATAGSRDLRDSGGRFVSIF